MRFRRAAALALAGWYLMVPPTVKNAGWQIDENAPLSRWKIEGSYDSADSCTSDQRTWITTLKSLYGPDYVKRITKLIGPNGANEQVTAFDGSLIESQCIASDDPRLKEK